MYFKCCKNDNLINLRKARVKVMWAKRINIGNFFS